MNIHFVEVHAPTFKAERLGATKLVSTSALKKKTGIVFSYGRDTEFEVDSGDTASLAKIEYIHINNILKKTFESGEGVIPKGRVTRGKRFHGTASPNPIPCRYDIRKSAAAKALRHDVSQGCCFDRTGDYLTVRGVGGHLTK
jgi:hypothetical protein